MSDATLEHDARHRLAGYLLALGFRDRNQREAVLSALEADVATGADDGPAGSDRASAAMAQVQAWYANLVEHVEPAQRLAARQWLQPRLPVLLLMHPRAFVDPAPLIDTIRTAMADDRACPPPLPKAHPQDMPRQPLGELPAVLRGAFWVSTARWSWPDRLRRTRSAEAE